MKLDAQVLGYAKGFDVGRQGGHHSSGLTFLLADSVAQRPVHPTGPIKPECRRDDFMQFCGPRRHVLGFIVPISLGTNIISCSKKKAPDQRKIRKVEKNYSPKQIDSAEEPAQSIPPDTETVKAGMQHCRLS